MKAALAKFWRASMRKPDVDALLRMGESATTSSLRLDARLRLAAKQLRSTCTGLYNDCMTTRPALEREAAYKAGQPTPEGLFVYQFETLCRNRLGYLDGIAAMAGDPLYNEAWRHFLATVGRHVGIVDFAELVYLRSTLYVMDQRR